MTTEESGIIQANPFFVLGKKAVDFSKFTSSHFKLQISPARLAVSIAKRSEAPTQLMFVSGNLSKSNPETNHKRSISSCE